MINIKFRTMVLIVGVASRRRTGEQGNRHRGDDLLLELDVVSLNVTVI